MILTPATPTEVGLPLSLQSFILLSGFMGAGKTTVGRRLAEKLGVDFVDLDALLESRRECTVAEFFATQGEAAFRDLESTLLDEVLAGAPAVVAVGGGSMLRAESRAAARRAGCLVTLAVSPAVAAERLRAQATQARPLFDADAAAFAARHAARAEAYTDADLVVDTDHRDVETVMFLLRAALATRGVL